ncbi:hypothetical protein DPSP01_013750 [Paraphaeosphaeria sporulosa]
MVPKTRSKTAPTGPSSVTAPKKPTRTAKPSSKPSKPDPSKTKPGPTKVTKCPAKKRFRNVPQGAGGTFALRFPTVIGTTACNTCLGLYVPLTTNKCFVAHFNIEPQPDDGGDREQELDDYEVGAACYRAVVSITKEFLNDAQWKGCWGPLTKEMRKGLRMVCPHAGLADTTHVGDAVAEGVTEFFGMTQRRRGEGELVPRSVENMLVRYTQGKAPQVIFSSAEELRNEWTARDEAENGIFETAGLFDDGRVKKGDDDRDEPETEGPFKARGTR